MVKTEAPYILLFNLGMCALVVASPCPKSSLTCGRAEVDEVSRQDAVGLLQAKVTMAKSEIANDFVDAYKANSCYDCSCEVWDGANNYGGCRNVTDTKPCSNYCVKCSLSEVLIESNSPVPDPVQCQQTTTMAPTTTSPTTVAPTTSQTTTMAPTTTSPTIVAPTTSQATTPPISSAGPPISSAEESISGAEEPEAPVEAPLCDSDQYQSDAVVMDCSGSSGIVTVDLERGKKTTIVEIPPYANGTSITLEANGDLDLQLYDGSNCKYGHSCTYSSSSAMTNTYGNLEVTFSGDDTSAPVTETITVKGITSKRFTVKVKAYATTEGKVTYSYGEINPCPAIKPGCSLCSSYPSCSAGRFPQCDGTAVVTCQATTTTAATTTTSTKATCANYQCPKGYALTNMQSTSLTQASCCQPTCEVFKCQANQFGKNPKSTNFTADNCCQAQFTTTIGSCLDPTVTPTWQAQGGACGCRVASKGECATFGRASHASVAQYDALTTSCYPLFLDQAAPTTCAHDCRPMLGANNVSFYVGDGKVRRNGKAEQFCLFLDVVKAWGCTTGSGTGCASCVAQEDRVDNTSCASCNSGYYLWNYTCKADSCVTATNLSTVSSPLSSSTTDFGNAPSCRKKRSYTAAAKEKIFYIDVPASHSVTIQTQECSYCMHELRWGGECPGDTGISCRKPDVNKDTHVEKWFNAQGTTQRVYFMIEGYQSYSLYDFILEWSVAETTTTTTAQAQWTIFKENSYCDEFIRLGKKKKDLTWQECQHKAIFDNRCGEFLFSNIPRGGWDGQQASGECACVASGKNCDIQPSSQHNDVYQRILTTTTTTAQASQ